MADYANLIERLRDTRGPSTWEDWYADKQIRREAADAVEALTAERDAPVSSLSPTNTRGYWEWNAKGWQTRAGAAEAARDRLAAALEAARANAQAEANKLGTADGLFKQAFLRIAENAREALAATEDSR